MTLHRGEEFDSLGHLTSAALRRLQREQIQALGELAAFCADRSIHFCLLAGSALGARRHGGMIPWDDDVDVGMLRNEFERFIAAAAEFSPKYHLQYWLTDDSLAQPLIKLRINGTKLIDTIAANCGGHKGIFLDIFPLDNVPPRKASFIWHTLQLKFWKRVLMHQRGYAVGQGALVKRFLDNLIGRVALRVPKERSAEALQQLLIKYDGTTTKRVIAAAGSYSAKTETLLRIWIEDARKVQFEHLDLPCPHPLDDYLTHLYGDFMTLPPPSERTNKHAFQHLEFSA